MYQFSEIRDGSAGIAVLKLDRALLRPASVPSLTDHIQLSLERFEELDLVVDLGVRIGSREWLRGFFTCAALCYAAYSLAPGMKPVPGASASIPPPAQWEEARALSISPLAYGADTGRRMAATDAVQILTDVPERPSVELLATIGRGDALARILRRTGVSDADAEAAISLISGVLPLSEIRSGTTMNVVLGRRPNKNVPRPLDQLGFRARFDLKLELKRVDGRLAVTAIPIRVDDTPLRIQGRVGSSLYRSARAAGVPAKAVETLIRAISQHMSISSVSADDRFDIIVEHRRAETGETETGQLLYAGLDRASGKDLKLMQWTVGGKAQWFDASGVGKESGMLQRPVPGTVSSNFGMRRHPILGYSRMHKGMDFRAGYGTPILAATDGRVTSAGWAGGYGRQVRIRHEGGLTTSYSHMSRITAKPGTFVKKGQVIGYVGSTGLSTGPHLHYEIYRNGVPINPSSVKFTSKAQLNGNDLAAFKKKLRSLLAVSSGSPKTESKNEMARSERKDNLKA